MRPALILLLLAGACSAPRHTLDPQSDTADTATERPRAQTRIGVCDVYDAIALTPEDMSATESALDELVDLGIGFARPHRTRGHAFSWNVVQPGGAGEYDFQLADGVVRGAQAAGVELVVTLYPYADVGPVGEAPPGLVPVLMPEDADGWRAFVEATVERYDGDGTADMDGLELPVRSWEIGTEPTCDVGDTACQQSFLDVVASAWESAHAADPGAVVLPGGAAPVLKMDGGLHEGPLALYRYFVDHGGLDYTDAFPFHMATGAPEPRVEDHVAFWRAELGADVPLWLGEMGNRSVGDARLVHPDPDREAEWLIATFESAIALDVQRILWCRAQGDLARAPAAYEAARAFLSTAD